MSLPWAYTWCDSHFVNSNPLNPSDFNFGWKGSKSGNRTLKYADGSDILRFGATQAERSKTHVGVNVHTRMKWKD